MVNSLEWTKYPSQKSVAITLLGGKKYYIEALHKEATGTDHLAVGWSLPNQTSISVIPGSSLSPYQVKDKLTAQGGYLRYNNSVVNGSDQAVDIVTDKAGNIYVTGSS